MTLGDRVWKVMVQTQQRSETHLAEDTSLLFTDNSRIEFRPEIDKLSWKLNSVLKDQGQEATSVPR